MESKCLFCEPCRAAVLQFLVEHGAFNFGFDPRSSPHFTSPVSSIRGIEGSRSSSCSLLEYSQTEQEERAKAWGESLRLESPDVMGLLLRGPFEPVTPGTSGVVPQASQVGMQDENAQSASENDEKTDGIEKTPSSSCSSHSEVEYFTASETEEKASSESSQPESPGVAAELPFGTVPSVNMQNVAVTNENDEEEFQWEQDGQNFELEKLLQKEIDDGIE